MKSYTCDVRQLSIRLVDVQEFVKHIVEPFLSEDCQKYNLLKNNKLLRQFIVYRLINHTLELLTSTNYKIVFVLNNNIHFSIFEKGDLFATNIFRKLVDLLSLNFLKTKSFLECVNFVSNVSGEGKEVRCILNGIIMSNRKNVNLQALSKLLEKYKIHKIQGDLKQNYKVKLGLFVT